MMQKLGVSLYIENQLLQWQTLCHYHQLSQRAVNLRTPLISQYLVADTIGNLNHCNLALPFIFYAAFNKLCPLYLLQIFLL